MKRKRKKRGKIELSRVIYTKGTMAIEELMSKQTLKQLQEIARTMKVKGYTKHNKKGLAKLLSNLVTEGKENPSDLRVLSPSELKDMAREHGILKSIIKDARKEKLVELLSMNEIPEECLEPTGLQALPLFKLKEMAKERRISNYNIMKKEKTYRTSLHE